MSSNAVGGLRDAGYRAGTLGYGRILDGLDQFDRLGAALGRERDRITHSALTAAAGNPQAFGHAPPAAPGLSAALAAYASSTAGHAALDKLAGAAAGLFNRLLSEKSAQQLRLPLEV